MAVSRVHETRDEPKARAGVLDPSGGEISLDPPQRFGSQRGRLIQPRVLALVTWHDSQRDAARARQRCQFIDPVAPVIDASEQADQHKPGPGQHLLDVKIDRIRMPQRAQVGETQRR